MSLATTTSGDPPFGTLPDTECKAQLSIAYAHAVATAARCALENIAVDYDTVDATIRQSARHDRFDTAALDIQLKCTSRHDIILPTEIKWPLERAHYDSLRNPRRFVPVVLVLLVVPDDPDERVIHSEDHLHLARCAYWVSLRDAPGIPEGQGRRTVSLPRAQVFDQVQLRGILSRIGNGGLP